MNGLFTLAFSSLSIRRPDYGAMLSSFKSWFKRVSRESKQNRQRIPSWQPRINMATELLALRWQFAAEPNLSFERTALGRPRSAAQVQHWVSRTTA